jgi:hypothetical protein
MFNEAAEDFEGASIVIRAAPGLTAEWLQRVVDCHIARDAAADADPVDVANSPLALPGISATVASASDGFSVMILSDDSAVAAEIRRRAQGMPVRL